MRNPHLAGLLAISTLVACGGRRIPGTDIQDTSDTRAIIAAIDGYRRAAEQRDPRAVLGLVSEKYFDDAGTPDPADDLDHQHLQGRIAEDYKNITALRLDIAVKKVTVDGDEAVAEVFYDQYYRIATKGGEVAKQTSDAHRMRLVREGGGWRFVSGL